MPNKPDAQRLALSAGSRPSAAKLPDCTRKGSFLARGALKGRLVPLLVLVMLIAMGTNAAGMGVERGESGALSASRRAFLPVVDVSAKPVLVHAPYVQSVTTNSAIVAWSTGTSGAGAGEVRYSVDQSYGLVAAADSRLVNGTYYHAARLLNLQAGTQYNYRIYTSGYNLTPWSTVSLKTATAGDSFSFVAFGDSRDGSQAAYNVANQMANWSTDFVLHVGDTVGTPASYALYDQQYFPVYRNLAGKVPFYVAPGNHEYDYGNPPQPFLDDFYFPTNGPAGLKGRAYSFDWGNAHFTAVDTNADYSVGSAQYVWLENDLASTNKLWKFVWLHHPPYSSGVEGNEGLPVRTTLGPLFDRYGVDMVFAGHSHNYERSYPMVGGHVAAAGQRGTIYFVTGGGGAPLYTVSGDFWTAYKAQINQFTRTAIQGCRLTTQGIDTAGHVFDSVSLDKCAPTAPLGQSGNWNLIFDDEFNGTALDTARWTTCYPWQTGTCSNESNHELELYNPEDVLIDHNAGALRLRAQKRDMAGWNGQTFHYTSGMVTTGGIEGQKAPSFSYTYGYAEARVRVPSGQGLWPAFWTLPTTYAWPPEIDVMEIIGQQSNVHNMTYHWTNGSGADFNQSSTWTGPDFSAAYHVFGMDWTSTAIVWYVDGVERARYSQSANIYNQPMYVLLNLAVGGDWPGPPNASTPFPSYFDIDYVRVWQRAGN